MLRILIIYIKCANKLQISYFRYKNSTHLFAVCQSNPSLNNPKTQTCRLTNEGPSSNVGPVLPPQSQHHRNCAVNVKTKGVKAHGIDTRQQTIAIGMGKMSLPMYSGPAPRHAPENINGKVGSIKPKPKLI